MNTAFKTSQSVEVLADEVTAKAPVDLIVALLSLALVYGVDRVEAAIRNTYTDRDAARIISGLNAAASIVAVLTDEVMDG